MQVLIAPKLLLRPLTLFLLGGAYLHNVSKIEDNFLGIKHIALFFVTLCPLRSTFKCHFYISDNLYGPDVINQRANSACPIWNRKIVKFGESLNISPKKIYFHTKSCNSFDYNVMIQIRRQYMILLIVIFIPKMFLIIQIFAISN